MGELRREGEPPDRAPGADQPAGCPETRGRPAELAEAYSIDRHKTTPVQRDFHGEMGDRELDTSDDVPYSIDWKTGEPRYDVRGVHDPIDETRPHDEAGGLAPVDQRDQWSLENMVPRDEDGRPERFPDPDGAWTDYVNDGGPGADQFRGNNCLDCSMAAIATYHGEPTVAAPRFPDRRPDGTVDARTGERSGPDRAEQWLGGRYENLGSGDDGLAVIEEKLREGGHGSSAAIINSWSAELGGGAHAWNAFNHNGEITWYDPQKAVTSGQPVYGGRHVRSVAAICIDSEGNQL